MSAFQFVSELPESATAFRGARSHRAEDAKEFRSHPNKWAKLWTSKTPAAASIYASNLRNGKVKAFPKEDPSGGQWEAAHDGSDIWVRYVK